MQLTTQTVSISFEVDGDFIFWLNWCQNNAGMEDMTLTVNGEGWDLCGRNIADQMLKLSYNRRLRASTLLTLKEGLKECSCVIFAHNAKDVYITPNV